MGTGPLKIHVKNQSKELCAVISEFLRSEGHEVVCCCDKNDFVRQIIDNAGDLAIIEVGMPELAAIEMLDRLHRSPIARNKPVIVISDFPELEFELPYIFDFICKPIDLGRLREDLQLLSSGVRRRGVALKAVALTVEEHQKFHDFLIQHSGLHFERRNIKVLQRGLESRMSALRIASCSDYYEYLRKNMDARGELQKLLQHLTVGETFFFRYHAHFDTLRQSLIPELVFKNRQEKIRIWSAGCSTGEEPYSIAMAIMESVPDWKKRDIRIIATDINSRSLKRAREGVFSAWKIRVTEKTYLEKYFTRIGESYVVKDEVKSLVDFSYLNLQVDIPPSKEKFDAIFCRNVMIYFTTATIRKLLETFASSLNSGGYLFLGHSETLSHISTGFERHVHGGSFYYRKKLELPEKQKVPEKELVKKPKPVPAASPPQIIPKRAPVVPTIRELTVEDLSVKAEQLLNQENYPEAAAIFAKILKINPLHAKALLGIGQVFFATNSTEEALANFNRAIELDDLNAEAYFLRGLLYEMLDRSAEALEEYRKAVLLDMEFIMPHYRLWRLSQAAGDIKTALREQNNCVRFLEKSGREAVIPFSNGLSREVFLEQLRKEIVRIESSND